MPKPGNLVRESEWLRVYAVDRNQLRYESKFVSEKLLVSRTDIQSRWSDFSKQEKSDFVMAFQSKHPLTDEDEGILEFLMDSGDDSVWSAIALPVARMSASKHKRVIDFLTERIKDGGLHRANYYQALAALNDPGVVPALRAAFYEDRTAVSMDRPLNTFEDIFPYVDYLACAAALYKLARSDEFKKAIDDMKSHPDANVRAQAESASRLL